MTSANSQDPPARTTADNRPAVDDRLDELELRLANMDSLIRFRTDAAGPPDRINRDFNLETRLSDLERRVQQINNEMLNLQRQVSNAERTANQAQNDARMAQQTARDAANRIR